MQVYHLYPKYLAYATADRRYAPESLDKLTDCFEKWILPLCGSIESADLSREDVTLLNSRLVGAKLSANRQYGILMWLKLFLRFCREELSLETLDPALIRLPRRPEPSVVFLTDVEVARVVDTIQLRSQSGKRLRALVELLLGTGLRISEALALRRRMFDERLEMFVITGKGGKRRKVFVTARALRWVTYYLHSRHDQSEYLFVTVGDHPKPWSRADISRFFRRLRSDARIEKPLSPHILRHTYCTNLLNNGVDVRFIRDLAGHRDIGTTARYYLGVDEQRLQEMVRTKLSYDGTDDRGYRSHPGRR